MNEKLRLSFCTLLVVGTLGFTSCTKDYVCKCTITYSGLPGVRDTSYTEYEITDSYNGAKDKCEANSKSWDQHGVLTEEKCKLF